MHWFIVIQLEIVVIHNPDDPATEVYPLWVPIDSRSPTRLFISVDFPTFGKPMIATKPDR